MVIGYHGKVNKKNGSDDTFLIADNSFQKYCVKMLSDLVSLSFVFWQPNPSGHRVVFAVTTCSLTNVPIPKRTLPM